MPGYPNSNSMGNPYAPNLSLGGGTPGFSLGMGGNPYAMPSYAQAGGSVGGLGGTLNSIGNFMASPAMLPISMGLGLLGGIIQGIGASSRRKKVQGAYQKGQQQYQEKATELFPELSQQSFQYQNPQLTNAIQAALGYRMGNMFPTWGMPAGMQGGAGSLQEILNLLMSPQQPQQAQAAPQRQAPQSRPRQAR